MWSCASILEPFLRLKAKICPFVSTAVQEVDLEKPIPVAHLHDFATGIPHGDCGTTMLVSSSGVACPIHVELALHLGDPQAVDDHMNMDIAAVIVSVQVGAVQPARLSWPPAGSAGFVISLLRK